MKTCAKCDEEFVSEDGGPGRPRILCDKCRAQKRGRKCWRCGEKFIGPADKRYCSLRCKERAHRSRNEIRQRERETRKFTEPMVYFIRAEDEIGPIKIGVSTWPEDRLRKLQTASPHRLKIVKMVPGGYGGERALHALFRDAHISGEWFEPVPGLLALLD